MFTCRLSLVEVMVAASPVTHVAPAIQRAGVILMQYLPFADPKALAVHDAFERAAYQLGNSVR